MKPKLRAQLIPTYRVLASDFEQYVTTVYRFRDYDFRLDVGCQRGEVLEYHVDGSPPKTIAFAEKFADVRRGRIPRRYPSVTLNALVQDGYIPAGRYLIDTKAEKPLVVQYTELMQKHGGPTAAECLAFCEAHSRDRVFLKRARLLNAAWGARG